MRTNQALLDRARNALVGLNGPASERLQGLIDEYEQCDQMSNVPFAYLQGKPERLIRQVMARCGHWGMRREDVGRQLERYLRKNT